MKEFRHQTTPVSDTSKFNPSVERVETLLRGGFDTGFDT